MTFVLRNRMLKIAYAILPIAVSVLFSPLAQAKLDVDHVNQELASANRAVTEGHVREGLEALAKLLGSIDPAEDKDTYWRTSTLLIELLSQTENHSLASQILKGLIETKIPQSQ